MLAKTPDDQMSCCQMNSTKNLTIVVNIFFQHLFLASERDTNQVIWMGCCHTQITQQHYPCPHPLLHCISSPESDVGCTERAPSKPAYTLLRSVATEFMDLWEGAFAGAMIAAIVVNRYHIGNHFVLVFDKGGRSVCVCSLHYKLIFHPSPLSSTRVRAIK